MYVKVQRVQCIILSLICSSYETKYVCIYVLLWYCEVHVASSNIMIWPQLTTIKIDDGLYLCSTKQCSCGQSKQNRREGKIIKYIPSLKEVYYIPSLKDLYYMYLKFQEQRFRMNILQTQTTMYFIKCIKIRI